MSRISHWSSSAAICTKTEFTDCAVPRTAL